MAVTHRSDGFYSFHPKGELSKLWRHSRAEGGRRAVVEASARAGRRGKRATSRVVQAMPRAPSHISWLLQELVPEAPPVSSPTRNLFDAISELVTEEPETPEDVEAVLGRWLQLEDEAVARNGDLSGCAFTDESAGNGTWSRALNVVRRSSAFVSSPFVGPLPRASPHRLRTRSMPAIPASRSAPSLRAMGHSISRESIASVDEPARTPPAMLRSGSVDAWPQPAEGEDRREDAEKLEDLRWVLLAKGCSALLYWRIVALIELALRIERSRGWWTRQHARPLRYVVWCGPRRWLRGPLLGPLLDGAIGQFQSVLARTLGLADPGTYWREQPSAVMTELHEQLLVRARHIGRHAVTYRYMPLHAVTYRHMPLHAVA